MENQTFKIGRFLRFECRLEGFPYRSAFVRTIWFMGIKVFASHTKVPAYWNNGKVEFDDKKEATGWERLAHWADPTQKSRIEAEREAHKATSERFWKRNEDYNTLSIAALELRQQVDDLTAKTHTIPQWRELLEFAFELDGHQYHRFPNPSDLPLNRYEVLQPLLIQLDNRLTNEELRHLTGICKKSFEGAIASANAGKRMEGLQKAMWAVQEIESRNEVLMFHPEILCDIAALFLIRDDEEPTVINEEVHKAKKQAFLLHGGEVAFFMKLGVYSLIQDAEKFIDKWQGHWDRHKSQTKTALRTYQEIHSSVSSGPG
jgi:hypothetical protein